MIYAFKRDSEADADKLFADKCARKAAKAASKKADKAAAAATKAEPKLDLDALGRALPEGEAGAESTTDMSSLGHEELGALINRVPHLRKLIPQTHALVGSTETHRAAEVPRVGFSACSHF